MSDELARVAFRHVESGQRLALQLSRGMLTTSDAATEFVALFSDLAGELRDHGMPVVTVDAEGKVT